jgi:Ankyrin repeat
LCAQDGRTALMHAVMGDKTKAFTALLAAHANIDAKDKVRGVNCLHSVLEYVVAADACMWRTIITTMAVVPVRSAQFMGIIIECAGWTHGTHSRCGG